MCSKPKAGAAGGADIHPGIPKLVVDMLGVWQGSGKGRYPAIKDFDYEERATFVSGSGPWVEYRQETWNPETGKRMHFESGFLRFPQDKQAGQAGEVEATLSDPTGQSQVYLGHINGPDLVLISTSVTPTATAKAVDEIHRTWTLRPDRSNLRVVVDMAAVDKHMQNHLHADLRPVSQPASVPIVKEVSCEQIAKKGHGTYDLLIDCREAAEFQEGHLDGALSMPLGFLISSKNEAWVAEQVKAGRSALIYCSSGKRSFVACQRLGLESGWFNIANMTGGIKGHRAASK